MCHSPKEKPPLRSDHCYLFGMNLPQLEEVICQVPAVDAVRVVSQGNTISEVHIVAALDKPAKYVVRDVQSIALAMMGIRIDRRTVSVVQVASASESKGQRVEILDINESVEGASASVCVSLAWGSDIVTGEASGSVAQAIRPRLIGDATLNAITQFTTSGHSFALSAIETLVVDGTSVAVAKVVLVSDGREQILIGSALAEPDTRTACVRSILDALNRHIPRFRR